MVTLFWEYGIRCLIRTTDMDFLPNAGEWLICSRCRKSRILWADINTIHMDSVGYNLSIRLSQFTLATASPRIILINVCNSRCLTWGFLN